MAFSTKSFTTAIQTMFSTKDTSNGAMFSSASLLDLLEATTANWTSMTYPAMSASGYRKNVIVYRCIRLISDAVGMLKWQVLTENKDEITSGPVYDLLNNPNPYQDITALMTDLQLYRSLSGNGYLRSIQFNNKPGELYAIKPNRVEVIPGDYLLPHEYRVHINDREQISIPVNQITGESDIMQLKYTHPTDNWYGLSPLQSAMMSVDTHNEAGVWNKKLLQNSGKTSGIFTTDANLSQDEMEAFRDHLDSRYSGAENAGKPLIGNNGFDYKQIGLTSQELDFLNSRNANARDIAVAFGVPAQMLNVPETQTYNNYKEAKLGFYTDTILPEADSLASGISKWLSLLFDEKVIVNYDMDAIEALNILRAERWDRLNRSTFLTPNEKRASLGMNPIEGGDKLDSAALEKENTPNPEDDVTNSTTGTSRGNLAPTGKVKNDEQKIAYKMVNVKNGHFHKYDPDIQTGSTTESDDHSHFYTECATKTGVTNGHTHDMSNNS